MGKYCDCGCAALNKLTTANMQKSKYEFALGKIAIVKCKVKCTLVQALRCCTGRTVQRGSRGIALLFLDHGTRRG